MAYFSFLPFFVLLLLFCGFDVALAQTVKNGKENKESHYKAGQVWSYKTRKNEEQSTLTILSVESDSKFGNIIHISVTGLKLKSPDPANGPIDTIGHLPFTEKAIEKSVVKLIKEDVELPEHNEGYDEWRIAFQEKKAGVYKTSVSEAIEKVEKRLNQQ